MLSEQDLRRVVAESMCDRRTVEKAYASKSVNMSSWTRVSLAAQRLALPTPPNPYTALETQLRRFYAASTEWHADCVCSCHSGAPETQHGPNSRCRCQPDPNKTEA